VLNMREDQSDAIELSSHQDDFVYKAVNFYRYRPADALDPSRGAEAHLLNGDGEKNQVVINKLTERRTRRSPCVTNMPIECHRRREARPETTKPSSRTSEEDN